MKPLYKANGSVASCGQNHYGQLGLGNFDSTPILSLIPSLNNVQRIAAGYYHSMAILSNNFSFSFLNKRKQKLTRWWKCLCIWRQFLWGDGSKS